MDAAKTVRIVYPENKRVGYANIAQADYNPEIHELWIDPETGKPFTPQGSDAPVAAAAPQAVVPLPDGGALPVVVSLPAVTEPPAFTIAKGPRGLWFVKDASGKNISSGYTSEDEASAERDRLAAG